MTTSPCARAQTHERAIMGEFAGALACLERARQIYESAPSGIVDHRTVKALNHARLSLPALRRAFKGLPEAVRLANIEAWMPFPGEMTAPPTQFGTERTEGSGGDDVVDVGSTAGIPPNRGRLIQIHPNYGFVEAGGSHYFFHRGRWIGKVDFTQLEKGTILHF
jgi:LuxR family glucitol operon transcriptional activator